MGNICVHLRNTEKQNKDMWCPVTDTDLINFKNYSDNVTERQTFHVDICMKIEGKLVKQVDSFVYFYRNTLCNDGGGMGSED